LYPSSLSRFSPESITASSAAPVVILVEAAGAELGSFLPHAAGRLTLVDSQPVLTPREPDLRVETRAAGRVGERHGEESRDGGKILYRSISI
jgi:hypothetical protein